MGDLNSWQINLHRLEDRERNDLETVVKASLAEYLVTSNQFIQIDPVMVHLRILARLKKRNDPNFVLIVNTITQIKEKIDQLELEARLLVMLIQPFIIGDSPLYNLINDFLQMLIINELLHYKIGPPTTLIDLDGLPEENRIWTTLDVLVKKQADCIEPYRKWPVDTFDTNILEVMWHAGKLGETSH